MTKHTNYSTDEIKQILDLRFNKKLTAKKIAKELNRTESAIHNVLHRYRCKGMYQPEELKKREEKVNVVVNASDEAKERIEELLKRTDDNVENEPIIIYQQREMTGREMIKKLYDMGYRIEDNILVCYVKQTVNVKDIING